MADRAYTTWTTDTCGCTIEYYNDDQSYRGTVRACPKHADVADTTTHLDEVLKHNREKNYVLNELIKSYGLDIEKDIIFVGYDPDAKKDNDPVVVHGLSEFLTKKGSEKTEDQIIDEIKIKLGVDVKKPVKASGVP